MKSWLEKNTLEKYSTHNKGKSAVGERFIGALKNKINKCIPSLSKNVYIDKLDDVVNRCNNTYHSKIKMKAVIVRIPKYKNIFAKGYTPNWSEEVFAIKKVKNIVPWPYVINDLNGEEIVGKFCKNELPETNQK